MDSFFSGVQLHFTIDLYTYLLSPAFFRLLFVFLAMFHQYIDLLLSQLWFYPAEIGVRQISIALFTHGNCQRNHEICVVRFSGESFNRSFLRGRIIMIIKLIRYATFYQTKIHVFVVCTSRHLPLHMIKSGKQISFIKIHCAVVKGTYYFMIAFPGDFIAGLFKTFKICLDFIMRI